MKTEMKPIKEVYPPSKTQEFFEVYDYNPLLKSMGYEILLKVDDEDYQGDSRLILKNQSSYGILIFGWGSCSGCDALQGCKNYQDVEDLRNELNQSIKWLDSASECIKYIKAHDWKMDFSWHSKEMNEFLKKAEKLLEKEKQ